MEFHHWIQLCLICIMGAMSPGPSLAVVLKNSISGGRRQGFFSGIGHGIGITFYAVIAVIGLVTFFKSIPNFFLISQLLGSLFLIWIGSKMIISFLNPEESKNYKNISKIKSRQGFVEGFLVAFLNPKIAAWILALFSQFVQPEASIINQIILITTVGGIDATWYCIVAILATSKNLIEGLRSNAKRIDLGMGILLILVAIGMLWRLLISNI